MIAVASEHENSDLSNVLFRQEFPAGTTLYVGSTQVFDDLPEEELRKVAGHFFRRTVERGETLFQRGQPAERIYIVEEGEVALVDPRNEMKPAEKLLDGDAIGELASIIGARHTVSAVATMEH